MRAVVHDRYGPPDVLTLTEVARPVLEPDEVLVKVRATTVNRTDCGFRQPRPLFVRLFSGLRRPRHRILGTELAGEIEATGAQVTDFAVGDRVFGLNGDGFGAHAEYVCVRQHAAIAKMPPAASFEEAAALPDGGVLALSCLRAAGLAGGQRILVYGASGSIGTSAVQLARHLGADITAVCTTHSVALVGSLGAHEVLDYTRETFLRPGDRYDVIFDAVGKLSYWPCRDSLVAGGVFVDTDLGLLWQNPLLHVATRWLGRHRVMMPIPRIRKQDVELLADLVERGEYRAVIDRIYPLERAVEATRYVETEQKTGSVVLTING